MLTSKGHYDNVVSHRLGPEFSLKLGTRPEQGRRIDLSRALRGRDLPSTALCPCGIVAMANNSTEDSNDSQFIIRLVRSSGVVWLTR
ncbi:hypothetical protein C8R46DRAFT_434950 [Mycena filopes]|nr:hypothetical protein C8R46DRAFT_434950 [Mycena filopes]